MDLDSFIITVFCLVDNATKEISQGRRLRQRGHNPTMAVCLMRMTMEVAGENLGLSQDQAIYRYFRRHYSHFFPALRAYPKTATNGSTSSPGTGNLPFVLSTVEGP